MKIVNKGSKIYITYIWALELQKVEIHRHRDADISVGELQANKP